MRKPLKWFVIAAICHALNDCKPNDEMQLEPLNLSG